MPGKGIYGPTRVASGGDLTATLESVNICERFTIEHFYLAVLSLIFHIFRAIPVAARSKAWVCGHSLVGILGSNPTAEHVCLL